MSRFWKSIAESGWVGGGRVKKKVMSRWWKCEKNVDEQVIEKG